MKYKYLLLFFIMAFSMGEVCAQEKAVFVIQSKDIAPYNEAFRGIEDGLSDGTRLHRSFLTDKNLKKNIEKEEFSVLVAIGTEAASLAVANSKGAPIIFTMVLDPVETGLVSSLDQNDERITGVMLGISIDDQFQKIKEVFPKVKKIGMLYDKEKKENLKIKAEKAAGRLNLKLVAQEVADASEVSAGLDKVIKQADVLWAGVDTLIYNPQSAQHILLETLRNKVPFMAFSSQYVKAGALMALESNYYDVGVQTVQMINKVLAGGAIADIPIESPQKLNLVTNQNTAKLIGVSFPETP